MLQVLQIWRARAAFPDLVLYFAFDYFACVLSYFCVIVADNATTTRVRCDEQAEVLVSLWAVLNV